MKPREEKNLLKKLKKLTSVHSKRDKLIMKKPSINSQANSLISKMILRKLQKKLNKTK